MSSQRLSKQDKEIFQMMKFNMKYLTKEQFLFIFESNVLEKNIRARLNQLLFYKELGCTTYEDIQKYINEIKKENKKNNIEIQRDQNLVENLG